MSNQYLAIIGDMVASRAVEDRALLQGRLRLALEAINDAYPDMVASAFIVTTGDEFQGLLHRPEKLDQMLGEIRHQLHPQALRFGVGIGGLDTARQPAAIGMDGPCFHRARDAIDLAKQRGTSIEVDVGVPRPGFEIYSLLYSQLRQGWTVRQRQVVDMAAGGVEGVEIARQLGISPSAVSQHLGAAGYGAVAEATRVWMAHLSERFDSQSEKGSG